MAVKQYSILFPFIMMAVIDSSITTLWLNIIFHRFSISSVMTQIDHTNYKQFEHELYDLEHVDELDELDYVEHYEHQL